MQKNHKILRFTVVAGAVAVIIIAIYWWTTISNQPIEVENPNSNYAREAALILKESNITPTAAEISRAQKQLSASKAVATEAQKQTALQILKGK